MIVAFSDERLARLFEYGEGAQRYSETIVRAFLRRTRALQAATDERTLQALQSLRLEPTRDRRHRGRYSLRLEDRWRLVVEISGEGDGKTVTILEISSGD